MSTATGLADTVSDDNGAAINKCMSEPSAVAYVDHSPACLSELQPPRLDQTMPRNLSEPWGKDKPQLVPA